MSAPDTNAGVQEKHHRPTLLGVRGAMIAGVVILLLSAGYNSLKTEAVVEGEGTAAATDIYAPGTNSSGTPTAAD